MAEWLHIEESPIDKSMLVPGAARAGRSKQEYVLTLRRVRVLTNKKRFGSAEVHARTVVIDGCAAARCPRRRARPTMFCST
jgi:hypothetical protein